MQFLDKLLGEALNPTPQWKTASMSKMSALMLSNTSPAHFTHKSKSKCSA